MARATLPLLLPGLLLLALHLRTLDYAFVWTDVPEIVEGSVLRPPGEILAAFGEPLQKVDDPRARHLAQPYYRPLQVVTASLLDRAFGREPRSFRGASLVLGMAALALFAALVRGLTGSAAAAGLAACLVAAHPVGLETWVWISGLSAALAAVFQLASLGLAAVALRRRGRVAAGWALGSVAALGLALLSKESAAATPALVVALGLSLACAEPAPERRPRAGAVAALAAAHAVAVVAYLALRARIFGTALPSMAPIGGSLETQLASSLAFWPQALLWLFAPLESNTSDAVRVVPSLLSPAPLAGAALALGSAGLWLLALRRGHALFALGLAWLWIAFLPTSGLVPLLHAHTERNLFGSVFGVALLWTAAARALRRRGAPGPLVAALGALLVAGLAERSVARAPDWRSTRALFERDVARDAHHREGRFNLAIELANEGRIAEAKHHVDVLVEQRGERAWSSFLLDEALLEVACQVYARSGDDAVTLRLLDEVREPTLQSWLMPGFHQCAAGALERASRPNEAMAIYAQLYRFTPTHQRAPLALDLARSALAAGRPDEARRWLAEVPRRGPLARAAAPLRVRLRRARDSGGLE